SFRTLDPKKIDVRAVQQPQFGWVNAVNDSDVAKRVAVIYEETSSFRTLQRVVLDVRRVTQPDQGWIIIPNTVVFDPKFWPAIEQLLRTYRVPYKKIIDVRRVLQPDSASWITPNLPPVPPVVGRQCLIVIIDVDEVTCIN